MTTLSPAVPAAADRPLLGVLLVVAFCILAPLGDAMGKLLGALPLGELLIARYALQAILLLPLVRCAGGSLALTPRVWALTMLRTLLHIVSLGAFFAALRFLPMAETVAICFVMPFILLLFGRLAGERVGPHRLGACVVGFAGTLMVVQPSFAAVGAPALLPLLSAVLFSFFMLVTRAIARETDPVALQAASGLAATAILAPLVLLAAGRGWPELDPVAVSGAEWILLLLLGVFGTAAHLAITYALRFAPSSTLAPMQYLELPFATLIGWAIFGDLPNGLAALGIAVTIAAGLYILHRERAASLSAPPAV
ncbi:DMT family transporter [Amaricoccus sp.]|uniref:DMT family transporter n=1 Tax=Amaricoccus sp. TaxID=1872485 RepID=UPI002632DEE6|nr:DMT family transporter [Amaricoccus sp.]HRO10998.1 DMT family transporter [Amaricoccus sp.]